MPRALEVDSDVDKEALIGSHLSDSEEESGACEVHKFGMIRRFALCKAFYVFLGPDWPASFVMTLIIFGVGGSYVAVVAPELGLQHIYIGILSMVVCSVTFL